MGGGGSFAGTGEESSSVGIGGDNSLGGGGGNSVGGGGSSVVDSRDDPL